VIYEGEGEGVGVVNLTLTLTLKFIQLFNYQSKFSSIQLFHRIAHWSDFLDIITQLDPYQSSFRGTLTQHDPHWSSFQVS
jgi:hypothetical protein